MRTKISFYTFGCRLNQSETASLENSFEQKDYEVVDIKTTSDIVVINTCTVTQGGDADTRRMVHQVNRLHPNARIALVGCQAQVQKEQLANLKNVSWIVGNERKMDLVNVFKEYPDTGRVNLITPTIKRNPFVLPVAAIDRQHVRANLKIQDGCDFFCTFCEIPYARGRARSRVFDDILQEANALVAAGHKELILTGINIGTYQYDSKDLLSVLQQLSLIAGLERLRVSSIEPTTIDKGIFEHMKNGKLCRYLHIPLQSGQDHILKEMERKYTVAEFSSFIRYAFREIKNICIGTDVIVGFPGETNDFFDQSVTLLKELPIHYFHVFSYSPRQMAKSKLSLTLSSSIITKRSKVLRELSHRKRRVFNESLLGQTYSVIFEGYKNGFWLGTTDNFVKVKVKDSNDNYRQLRKVRLLTCDDQEIIGEMV